MFFLMLPGCVGWKWAVGEGCVPAYLCAPVSAFFLLQLTVTNIFELQVTGDGAQVFPRKSSLTRSSFALDGLATMYTHIRPC